MNIPTLNFKQPPHSVGSPVTPRSATKTAAATPAATLDLSKEAQRALLSSKTPFQGSSPENIIWGNSPKRQ